MPQLVHSYRIEASYGPQEVFRTLRKVCEHPPRPGGADFEFDWVGRRVALIAGDRDVVQALHDDFRALLVRAGIAPDLLLAGPVTQRPDGRLVQPFGVLIQDPATFGEMIGRSLVEIGLRGVQVVDSADCCRINVRLGASAQVLDYNALITEYPLPPYLKLTDEGQRPVEPPVTRPPRKKRRKR